MKYLFLGLVLFFTTHIYSQKLVEKLDRGTVAIRSGNGNLVSWRLLGPEYNTNIAFNIYRNGAKINNAPISTKTNYWDSGAPSQAQYYIRSVVNGVEQDASKTITAWGEQKLRIPILKPSTGKTPSNEDYTYSPNDASVADLDGDGDYEVILKWYPSNAKDNSQSGYTGNCILDAYTLEGTLLWRLDLGINIRSGAHYTQFMVYDLDSDGKAELVCKTAPGTKDGLGNFLQKGPAANDNDNADYRTTNGYVLSGPEYLTVFNGETGAEMATINYIPPRGNINDWGDDYGNRVDRFLAGVAYLDGVNPSVFFTRGYYTRTVIAAFDWNGTDISERWTFDSGTNSSNPYYGQGNHNLSVGDLDGDGKDEIQFGSMAIDDDGTGLYSTDFGHGDAGHLSDLDPSRPGLEFFMPHEEANGTTIPALDFRDPSNGNVLWSVAGAGDFGRGICQDIDPNYWGCECWGSGGAGVYDSKGNVIHTKLPSSTGGGVSINMGIWWDGDLLKEILDKTVINKYNYNTEGTDRLFTIYNEGITDINGTKSNPSLVADILGDWREEVIFPESTGDALILFATPYESDELLYTLMHDAQYRCAIAWQNVSYNQPPLPSFYLGADMTTAPVPNIEIVNANINVEPKGNKYQLEDICMYDGTIDSNNPGFEGTGFINTSNNLGASLSFYISSLSTQIDTVNIRYSNGSLLNRKCNISINNQAALNVNFLNTNNWSTWEYSQVILDLEQGISKITITALTDEGGPNLDYILLPDNLSINPCSTQNISLNRGWNLISTNVIPSDANIEYVFSGLDVDIIKNADGFWKAGQAPELNRLTEITAGEGYLVKMNTEGVLSINGTVQTPLMASVQSGWQMLGCPYQTTTPFTTYFNSTNTETIKNFEGFWKPDGTMNSINELEPGKGYYMLGK